MKKTFLDVDGIHTEAEAIQWSMNAAVGVRKGARVYKSEENREQLRAQWAKLMRDAAQQYIEPPEAITDDRHCEAIQKIADALSVQNESCLSNGRLRFGVSQKALNLYLKYLWCMGSISMPPHCPIDGIVLAAAGIDGSWTKSDSATEYMGWIARIRIIAAPRSLAEWELEVWLRDRPGAPKPSSTVC